MQDFKIVCACIFGGQSTRHVRSSNCSNLIQSLIAENIVIGTGLATNELVCRKPCYEEAKQQRTKVLAGKQAIAKKPSGFKKFTLVVRL